MNYVRRNHFDGGGGDGGWESLCATLHCRVPNMPRGRNPSRQLHELKGNYPARFRRAIGRLSYTRRYDSVRDTGEMEDRAPEVRVLTTEVCNDNGNPEGLPYQENEPARSNDKGAVHRGERQVMTMATLKAAVYRNAYRDNNGRSQR